MIGEHVIKTWSNTQAIIALSSGEAEFYGAIRAACEGLGLSTLYKEFGFDLKVKLSLDASAAKGIIERQGVCKIRHLDVGIIRMPFGAQKVKHKKPTHIRTYIRTHKQTDIA